MAKAEKYSTRIDFRDDVRTTRKIKDVTPEIKDVTDLIKYMRDAVCHPDLEMLRMASPRARISLTIVTGKRLDAPAIILPGGATGPNCEYDDDVAHCFGSQRIYLKRHIIRAFEEAKAKLLPIIRKGFRVS